MFKLFLTMCLHMNDNVCMIADARETEEIPIKPLFQIQFQWI